MRDPRRCDMACKTTWQSHADPRGHLRGAEVTRGAIYIFIYLYSYKYKRPDYQNSLTHKTALPFKRVKYFLFLRVGLCSLLLFYFQDTWNYVIRWIRASGLSCVDAVDAKSTGSSIKHVLKSRFK